jgi:hypothetical protein
VCLTSHSKELRFERRSNGAASRYVGNSSSFTERARRDSTWETRGVCVKQKTRECRNLQPNGNMEKENDRSQQLMERNVKTKFSSGLL